MTEQERLQMLMRTEEMSAKDFAAEVGISAATMSNILNGRNKPSLEVLQKVLNRFRLVSSDWLILGIGSMYKSKQAGHEQTLFDVKPNEPENKAGDERSETFATKNGKILTDSNDNGIIAANSKVGNSSADSFRKAYLNSDQVKLSPAIEKIVDKKVSKVIIFFDDGSYQEL